jgi:hypothetical protein
MTGKMIPVSGAILFLRQATIPEASDARLERLMKIAQDMWVLDPITGSERYFIDGVVKILNKAKLPKGGEK